MKAPDVGGPALAMIELDGAPSGFVALDAMAKKAPIRVIAAGTVQSGRWLVLFSGEVEPVQMSFDRASEVAEGALVDAVLLPYAEPRMMPMLLDGAPRFPRPGDSLLVIETATSPTLLRAVDAALKGAQVDLVELRVAEGLAGKGLSTLWGKQHDVEAAMEHAQAAFVRGRATGCTTTLIANADSEVGRALQGGTRFFKELRG